MKNNRQKRRIRVREVKQAYQIEVEMEGIRQKIKNLFEMQMIDSDDYTYINEQFDKIDENMKATIMTIGTIREKMKWLSL